MKQKLLVEFELPNMEEMCDRCECINQIEPLREFSFTDGRRITQLCERNKRMQLLYDLNLILYFEVSRLLEQYEEEIAEQLAAHCLQHYYKYFFKRTRLREREEIIRRGTQIQFSHDSAGFQYIASKILCSTDEETEEATPLEEVKIEWKDGYKPKD